MRNKSLLLLGTCLFIAQIVLGGIRDFSYVTYSTDQDFEGVFVYTIVQEKDGFLWIGSDDGLYRFDGKQMLNLNDRDSTIGNLVTSSIISPDGHLYLGYYEGGISVVEHGQYRKIIDQETLPYKITSFKVDGNNIVWALTQNKGLIEIRNDTTLHHIIPALDESISYDFIIKEKEICIATNIGLLRVKRDEAFSVIGFVEGLLDIQVNTLSPDKTADSIIWVGTDSGLYTFNTQTHGVARVNHISSDFRISSIDMDDLGSIWVATKNSGLLEIIRDKQKIKYITRFNKGNGLVSNELGKVYVDKENEVWVGTFGKGLIQMNRAYFHHYELNKTIKVRGVHAIADYNKEEFLLGTESGLVRAYKAGMKDSLVFDLLEFTKQYAFIAFVVDGDVVWAGTKKNGMLKINLKSKRVEQLLLNPLDPVLNHLIRDVKKDRDGNIWVSASGNGVYQMNPKGEVLNHLNTKKGFYHNEIYTIYPDKDGNVWFGSHATGLALLKPDGDIEYLTRDEIFPAYDINSIIQDDNGIIWIATEGYGVYRFNGEEFERFDAKNGLLSDFCHSIIVDDIGAIWVGHRLGISMIHPENKIIRRFNHPNELGETEAELNAVNKDASGNIYFGNPYGLTKVNLPHFNFKTQTRKSHIKDIRIFFEQVDLTAFSNFEKIDNLLPNDLEFDYTDSHLTFDFVSINLRNPEALYYQYRLEGIDKGWSPVDKVDHASYPNLSPGKYTFKVRQSDHPDLWTNQYASLSFTINSPYWEKWWFYFLEIGFILSVILLTFFISSRLRNRSIVKLTVYVSIFILFEYVHTGFEPYLDKFSGEVAIFKVGLNLVLALLLFPIESKLTSYLKRRSDRNEQSKGIGGVVKHSLSIKETQKK